MNKIIGDDKPLGRWCSRVRRSMQRIKNNEAPRIAGFSEDRIKRLEDIGFEWKVKKERKPYVISFEERFEELEEYKAKHGHCDVKTRASDNKPLGRWCSKVRRSMQRIRTIKLPSSQQEFQRITSNVSKLLDFIKLTRKI